MMDLQRFRVLPTPSGVTILAAGKDWSAHWNTPRSCFQPAAFAAFSIQLRLRRNRAFKTELARNKRDTEFEASFSEGCYTLHVPRTL